jgi:hypothetical protein
MVTEHGSGGGGTPPALENFEGSLASLLKKNGVKNAGPSKN